MDLTSKQGVVAIAMDGISMMVFKGQANDSFYPVVGHRATGNLDCWLFGDAEKGDFLKAEQDKVDRTAYNVFFKRYKQDRFAAVITM